MSGKIFINYRRGDDPGSTGRLFDRLEEAFERDQLFMDVDSIPPGRDFVRLLEERVAECDVLLAIIGKGWIEACDERGVRRLDKPDDFVRIEIASALKQDKLVIPVLVHEARMPTAEELPEAIRPLARRNAVRLAHERFRADTQGLIKAIQQALNEASAVRGARDEKRLEKEKARLVAMAGLSAEQITKVEELQNWDLIKASAIPSAQEFRNHIARFPGGVTERLARARLEDLVWTELGTAPTLDQLADFLTEFPQGVHAKEAAERQGALKEEQQRHEMKAWEAAKKAGTAKALGKFLDEWPEGQYADEAWSRIIEKSDAAALGAFLKEGAQGKHADAARSRIKELERTRRRDALRLKRARWLEILSELSPGLIYGIFFLAIFIGPWLVAQKPSAPPIPSAPTKPQPPNYLIRTFAGHSGGITSVAFSPDGHTVLSGSSDKTLRLWEVATAKELRTFTGHSGEVTSFAFSPDGRTVLSGSRDNTLKLWEVATGKELRTFKGHGSYRSSVAFSPDGRTAVSGGWDQMVRVREVSTGKELVTFVRAGMVESVAFSPDGRTVLSGGYDNPFKLWSIASRKELRSFQGHSEPVLSVAYSPDGLTVLSGSRDKTLRLWDVTTGRELRPLSGHSANVTSVAFSPDGLTILSGSWDATVRLWEVATSKELRRFGAGGLVQSVAFSPDGRTALSGNYNKDLQLWELTKP